MDLEDGDQETESEVLMELDLSEMKKYKGRLQRFMKDT